MKNLKKVFQIIVTTVMVNASGMAQTWTVGEDIPQAFRASNVAAHKSTSTNSGYLFLISGRDSEGNITPRNQRYDISNNVWEDMAPAPTGILGASTAIVKDSIYIIGGLTSTPGTAIKKVRRYSINQNTWADKADFPVNIVDTDAVSYQDSLIYVTAGYNSRVRVFNAITNKWRDATPMTSPLQSIAWGALTIHGNKLVYMCGTNALFSPNYFNTVRIGTIDQNNRANITWTTGTPFPGQTRTFFDAHSWNGGIIMTGGSTDNTFDTNSDECYFYNVDTDVWTQLPSKPTAWVTGNSASLNIDNEWKLICASGYNNGGYLYSTEIYTETQLSRDEFASEPQINFFPNPTNGFLQFDTSELVKEIICYDMHGKAINLKIISNNTLDVSNLAQGVYLIKVIGENDKIVSAKFVKN
ncbi:T9SS type A sorting domain-containing protein [Flavobacterium sedimenticola]|uniref:Kelch repeat-containing protein n=1 Tax=Flavobacterium sedimenticola TaxID=3043286 RepID=A0ABT6XS44_9FLAO|nr:kelch repeat-containing protein [Flavobacterium sedimenticola]MDI9257900.1 kelch repeat-containing protein [Flavobacterium sedimenticola]